MVILFEFYAIIIEGGISMSEVVEKVKTFAKRASSVKHSGQIAYVAKQSELDTLNKSIEPKIRQNARERKESFESASKVIIK